LLRIAIEDLFLVTGNLALLPGVKGDELGKLAFDREVNAALQLGCDLLADIAPLFSGVEGDGA
jgi:hypothetical protein